MANILVVDDEAVLRRLLRAVLGTQGHSVVEAPDGESGLARLSEDPPIDLVITDYQMPDMDGLEFGRLVRGQYPDIKLIMVTGAGARVIANVTAAAREIGFETLIPKPFSIRVLIEAVASALARR